MVRKAKRCCLWCKRSHRLSLAYAHRGGSKGQVSDYRNSRLKIFIFYLRKHNSLDKISITFKIQIQFAYIYILWKPARKKFFDQICNGSWNIIWGTKTKIYLYFYWTQKIDLRFMRVWERFVSSNWIKMVPLETNIYRCTHFYVKTLAIGNCGPNIQTLSICLNVWTWQKWRGFQNTISEFAFEKTHTYTICRLNLSLYRVHKDGKMKIQCRK